MPLAELREFMGREGIPFETQRAASGGTLTARELWVERIWLVRVLASTLPYGDAGQWPFIPLVLFARFEAWPERHRPCHW
jgi:hypothetical protein